MYSVAAAGRAAREVIDSTFGVVTNLQLSGPKFLGTLDGGSG
jgi:hypothetical protein